MNGTVAARLPKHAEVSDAPVSSNFLKRLWWRYAQSAQRASPPPRLLLVLLLLAQILFLGIVRLGPGGALWTLRSADGFLPSSSMSSSLVVGRVMSARRPLKFLPQGGEEDGEREALMSLRPLPLSSSSLITSTSTSTHTSTSTSSPLSFVHDDKDSTMASSAHEQKVADAASNASMLKSEEAPTLTDFTNDVLKDKFVAEPAGSGASPLDTSNRSSLSEDMALLSDNVVVPPFTEENKGIDEMAREDSDGFGGVHNAAAMVTSSGEAKKEQALIAQKVSESAPGRGEGEVKGRGELVRQEELTFSEDKASDIASTSELHAGLNVKDEREKGQEEIVATASQDYARTELQLVQDVHTNELAHKVEERSDSSECKYGYIYVYDLPPVFNRDIVANCTSLNVFQDVCHTLLNDGLGASLGDASPLGQTGSWFISDQFTAEIVFHNRMLQHPCVTDKPEQASGFYVPYYAGLDVGRYLWQEFSAERRDRVGNQLLEWLGEQKTWKKNGGWGHFMMIGRITWDFRRSKDEDWGSGIFNYPSMQNMTRLIIERNPWDYMEMAVPYPTNFHPQSDADLIAWQSHVRSIKRSNLFSFAGAPRSTFPNDFRGILLDQCQRAQSCQALDCSNRTCENNQKTLELFMGSTFCLQPRGDSFTRRSTFDCLLAGSIPVFFWHRSAYMQYKWHLPEDVGSYSVFISKDDMRNGTKIEEVLNSFSTEKVEAMRETVIDMIPRIVYAGTGFSLKEKRPDAFDVAIEGVMERFKELNLSSKRR
eukprot:c11724_g1_i1 orf=622-2922(+)